MKNTSFLSSILPGSTDLKRMALVLPVLVFSSAATGLLAQEDIAKKFDAAGLGADKTELVAGVALEAAASAVAASPEQRLPEVSPIQYRSPSYDLLLAGKVMIGGTDEASEKFQKEALPSIAKLINTNLGETSKFVDASKFALDPAKLLMSVESTARVYFVGEGAGYMNTLGFNTVPLGGEFSKTGLDETSRLIFPNASSSVSTYNPAQKVERTVTNPLLPGDFVDLGAFKAGSTLDFFLVADGAKGGKTVWTAPSWRNADGIDHMVAFALPGSPYLVLAFEDLMAGGDRDYNDVVFAVDIGAINVQRLLSTPEPAAWASVIALGAVAFIWRRRLNAGTGSARV